jgi:hypothetical protein
MGSFKIAFFCWESIYSERIGGLSPGATYLAEVLARKNEVHFFTRGGEDRTTEASNNSTNNRPQATRMVGSPLLYLATNLASVAMPILDESKVSEGPRFKGLEIELHCYPGARVLRVVHPGEHDVLDEHLASAQLNVAPALGQHGVEGVTVVHRHELGSLHGIGSVYRDRQSYRLLHFIHEAS